MNSGIFVDEECLILGLFLKSSGLIRIPDDVLPTLLLEVKLHNPSFPTDLIFNQLKSRRNLEKTKFTVKPAGRSSKPVS